MSAPSPERRSILLLVVAGSVGFASGVFAYTIAAGLTGSLPGATLIAIVVAGLVAWVFQRRPVVPLVGASRGLEIVAAVATIVALVQLTRLAVFMVDSSQPRYSFFPASDWEVRHSCVSAYFVAAQAADRVPDIYADSLYSLPQHDPQAKRKPRFIGPFKVDVYEYPPPFLIVPRLLRRVFPDFVRFRMMWFGLNSAVILFAMLMLAGALGPVAGMRALLLLPLVWAALPTIGMLQKGNAQGMVIALAWLAMVAFERRRWAAGGALLAYATVSKLYPGLLSVYLLVRREWRALIWTAGFCVALAGLTLMDMGWASYHAFLGHLPGLLGGEAFPALRTPPPVATNFSMPGLVFKLKLFGVPGMNFATSKLIGWIYTLIAVGVIVLAARRPKSDPQRPLVWLAIIILATLRSPFLPQAYAGFPALVLLVLLAATSAPSPRAMAALVLVWLVFNIFWPLDWSIDPRLLALLSTIPQVAMITLAIVALKRSARDVPAAASA